MDNKLLEIIILLVPLLLSLSIHEYAHARAAYWLGDPTAQLSGRMTINPIAHIDPIGSILMPALIVISGSNFLFGWAKPVPVNPVRFRKRLGAKWLSMREGMMITALAGPLSNLVLGFLTVGVFMLLYNFTNIPVSNILFHIVFMTVVLNFVLAIFNMIPLPPLDGSKVLAGLLPRSAIGWIDWLEANPMISIFILIALLGTGIIGTVLGPVINLLLRLSGSVWGIDFF